MAMVGGILAALIVGRADPGFVNGALAGLVAVCAGSDVMHPIGSLITGGVAGVLFVYFFVLCQERLKIDDVLGNMAATRAGRYVGRSGCRYFRYASPWWPWWGKLCFSWLAR